MYSARGAENAAVIHYTERGFDVIDTAIQQVTGLSSEWKLYDLKVSGQGIFKFIDVKNSRRSFSNRDRFREFCVPQFKRSRSQDEVIILGVLSPYISGLRSNQNGYKNEDIIILGECKQSLLEDLQVRCNGIIQGKLRLSIRKESFLKKGYLSEYLPPWLFDFDSIFYKERHEVEKNYQNLKQEDTPTLSDLSTLNLRPLSLALCSSGEFPENWTKELKASEIRFSEILKAFLQKDGARLMLPHIFLSILIHFIENCLSPSPDYSPTIYKQLIFNNSSMPMGVRDPLSTIWVMCEILEKIWQLCRDQLSQFSYYRFDSRGILQGYDNKGRLKTIIAYCGGRIQ
ncbi:MAG TPA: hypothetical protein VIQ31_36045, partial [Phormidium sp.]